MNRISQYDVYALPVADIFYDAAFNCRRPVTVLSVQDLARSIDDIGLQAPVVVQPWTTKPYRLVSGHRRFVAVAKILKWSTIPATIREMDSAQAHLLNLIENMEREDLNIVETAQAISNLSANRTQDEVAAILQRSNRWVQVHLRLLTMPEEVQRWAAAGVIGFGHLRDMAGLPPEEQIKYVQAVIRARGQRTSKPGLNFDGPARKRSKDELAHMTQLLFDRDISGLPTRLLAWAAGYLETETIMKELPQCEQ